MAVKVLIPGVLKHYLKDKDIILASAENLKALLKQLIEQYPKLTKHIFSENHEIRPFISVYLNENDIRDLDWLNTNLTSGDVVSIIPSIAGGMDTVESTLSKSEMERYSRHLLLPDVAVSGQKKLKEASVLLVGAGGLGSPAGLYLAAAGVGRLGIVDFDVVDETNLQRQVIYTTEDVATQKIEAAGRRLQALNPNIKIEKYPLKLDSGNALDIFDKYDIVLDGTDNFPTRYLVNDACVLLGKPNTYGSIFRFEGQASVFWAEKGPCYRCLYPEPPPPGLVPSCAEGGVLGILPGTIGLIQATEAVKLIVGIGQPLIGRLLLYDALTMSFRELKLRKDPDCPVCGKRPTITELIDYEHFCGIGSGKPDKLAAELEISVTELNAKILGLEKPFILDVGEPQECQICKLPHARMIPLARLNDTLDELDPAQETYVYCRSGVRSAKAVKLLLEKGFRRVKNVKGGILAWASQIDPDMPKY